MKKLLILAVFIASCQKTEMIRSSDSSAITESITFSANILPERKSLQLGDRFLIGDTFSGSGVITGIRFKVSNLGGYTERVKVFIDDILFDTILTPVDLGFGQLLFEFSGESILSEGIHFLEIRGNSKGLDSLNVYFTVESITSDNSISGLPIQKIRRYKN